MALRLLATVLFVSAWVAASIPARSQTPPLKSPLKIYIVTDLEGASGVYKFSQTREAESPLYRPACEWLMGDLAAVVRGLRAGGAQEILILDGHGLQAFVPELMAAGAKYITGKPRPGVLWGLDETYAGLIVVGQHAMAGTPDGILSHTQSSRTENRYWYNGIESGELAQVAAYAAHYGVPPVMVTGDEAACREARKFFGEHCVTVAVKQGLAREAGVLYPFEETRKALYASAKRAVAAIPLCKPYTVQFPAKAKKTYLVFDQESPDGKLVTKEGEIATALEIFSF